jgi:hypothetical protein
VLLIANPAVGRIAHFEPTRMQAHLRLAAAQLGWTPPDVNLLRHVLRTTNYNASVTASTSFHIPSKLRKLKQARDEDTSTGDYDMSIDGPPTGDPQLRSVLEHGIQTLAQHHMHAVGSMLHPLSTQMAVA